MARKSIESRMDRIMDALLPPHSFERREYMLPEDLKELLQIHRTKVDGIIRALEKNDLGTAYAAVADRTLELPAMPAVLRDALGLSVPPTVYEDMSVGEAAAIWTDYAFGEDR